MKIEDIFDKKDLDHLADRELVSLQNAIDDTTNEMINPERKLIKQNFQLIFLAGKVSSLNQTTKIFD